MMETKPLEIDHINLQTFFLETGIEGFKSENRAIYNEWFDRKLRIELYSLLKSIAITLNNNAQGNT